MRNFYFVTSLNLINPKIKTLLSNISIITNNTIDFKLRSRLYLSYSEAINASVKDFNDKLHLLYTDDKEHQVSSFSVSNPEIFPSNESNLELLGKFGDKYLDGWDDNCCSVVFYADIQNISETDKIIPMYESWMFKYEIFYSEDSIELSGNGDFIFSQINVARSEFTSTYH